MEIPLPRIEIGLVRYLVADVAERAGRVEGCMSRASRGDSQTVQSVRQIVAIVPINKSPFRIQRIFVMDRRQRMFKVARNVQAGALPRWTALVQGNRENMFAAGAQNAMDLGKAFPGIGHMFQHVLTDYQVKRVVGKAQAGSVLAKDAGFIVRT